MTRHQSLPQAVRRTTRICYIIALGYAAIGLGILVWSVIAGGTLGVLLGFLGLGGALGATFIASVLIHLSADFSAAAESLDEARARLAQIEEKSLTGSAETSEPATAMLNLAATGKGDPSALVGAMLNRSTFPRLIATMDDEPPAESGPTCSQGNHAALDGSGSLTVSTGIATKNLLRAWRVAQREGDLAACSRIYPILADTADAHTVASLTTQLQQLRNRAEKTLREAFSSRIHEGDYAGALQVGEQICNLWPDERIARDFERIRPYLLRKVV